MLGLCRRETKVTLASSVINRTARLLHVGGAAAATAAAAQRQILLVLLTSSDARDIRLGDSSVYACHREPINATTNYITLRALGWTKRLQFNYTESLT